MVTLIRSDLQFILDQILIAEQHAGGANLATLVGDPTLPFGLRTVDGTFNNLVPGQENFGAADQLFPRLLPADFRPAEGGTDYGNPGFVLDSQPRIISNLIVDQTANNPAAVDAAGPTPTVLANGSFFIPNVAPDEGLSAPFNSWMTFFGQFFDHGLDLVTKGGNSIVFIPLAADDPLRTHGPNGIPGDGDEVVAGVNDFMVLTRATPFGLNGDEARNTTTPFVDQNQTYTSHPSHQVFLREYALDGNGDPVATGRLLDGASGGIGTWADVKLQAANLLGITLTDADVTNVPLLATDQYGKFIPGANGFAQIVTATGLVEGAAGGIAIPANAFKTGHGFLDDIAHTAAPNGRAADANTSADDHFDQTGVVGGATATTYDNELLDAHFATGDGRGNENIGLTSVHHVFHSEHNRLVDQFQQTILATGDAAFIAQWQLPDGSWNGERIFQAARFGTEMQYQHLVFEEFARKVQPEVNIFAGYDSTIDPAIFAEFAHTVYRFGHSMLTETIARLNPDGTTNDIGLIQAFLNPLAFDNNGTISADVAAGAVIRGMTRQVANEIDEFVTGVLRNNLLGLPLDLPSINIARGRDTGIPTLNDARREFFDGTGDSQLKPYDSWVDFAGHLAHELSIVNFIAAYGTHIDITSETTLAGKRAAAEAIVFGTGTPPPDAVDFLNGTGTWAGVETGLNLVDLWIGGLAERHMPFGGLLGSTFNFVFETQMEKLQDGDRLYYLHRLAGTNFLTELENNSFTALVEKNTDLGTDGMHLPADLFSTPNFILEIDQSKQLNEGLGSADPVGGTTLNPLVSRNNPNTPGLDTNYLKFSGGEHVVLGGTNPGNLANPSGNDILIASIGDDAVWGDGGNDRIEGGAGNDILNGGDGDDIITDSFGIDNIKGGAGNDVLSAGAGTGDLILAGDGNDFVVAGRDPKETFGGTGNDFISAGDSADIVFGNEGDDWIEGGDQADLLQGDNGNPFQDSGVVGNDVIFGDGGNDDYDSESGDDIMVAGLGTERFEGMLGFDWVTHKGNVAADADLFFTGLLPPDRDAIRDRFDLVEALSGGNAGDILRGDNATVLELTAIDPTSGQNNALNNAAQVALINGLQAQVLGGATSFSGGNIILGGDGNDIMEGRGGNDILDGDRWLNVRISVRANPDGTGAEILTVNSMAQLQAAMFAGTINPGQLAIVREILNAPTPGDIDTAVFTGNRADYTVTTVGGVTTVTDNVGADGIDTLRNTEQLGFADGLFTTANPNVNINVAPLAVDDLAAVRVNTPITINVLGNDIDPNVGQVLRITSINGTPVLEGDAPIAIANGTVQLVSGRLIFNPATGFTGVVEFDYTVSDGNGGSDVGRVAVTVGTVANTAPTISSNGGGAAATIAFASGSNAIVTDVNFTDAQTTVGSSFALLGADAARFTINAAGVLSFVTPPNFAAPTDVGLNNSYNVTVRVTDGGGLTDTQALTVNVFAVNQAPVGNVTISDTRPTEGQALTLANGITDPNGTAGTVFNFQWQSFNGATWVPILGATGATFTPGAAQVGQQLRVVTTFTDNQGNAETVTSAATTVVGDLIIGTNLSQAHTGTAGDDSISGLGGNDTINGGVGNDTMVGGTGNDTFVVDSTGDVVTELAGQGTDLIQTTLASFSLATNGANVENLTFTGAGDFTGTGNTLNNTITGGAGNDTLDGGAGFDFMNGGTGNDTYVIDLLGEMVVLTDTAGIDTIRTSLTNVTLMNANIENLAFTGAGNFTGTGNNTNNQITGGAGNDTLNGGIGNDTMTGGGGNDTFNVTLGNDTLVFASGFGNDTVSAGFDFDPAGGGQDLLDIRALGVTAAIFNAQVVIADIGAHVLVTIGGSASVQLTGVANIASITQTDFILSP